MARRNENFMVISGFGDQELCHWSTDSEERAIEIFEIKEAKGHWAMIFDLNTYFELWPEQKLRQGKIVQQFKKKYL